MPERSRESLDTAGRDDRRMDAVVPDPLGKRSILSAAFFTRGFGNSSSPRSPFPPSSRSEFDGGPVSQRRGPSFSLLCMSLIPYTSDLFAAFVLHAAVGRRRKCVGPLTLRVSRLGRRGARRAAALLRKSRAVGIRKYLVPKKQHPFPLTDHEIAGIGKAAVILGTLIVKRYRFPKRASRLPGPAITLETRGNCKVRPSFCCREDPRRGTVPDESDRGGFVLAPNRLVHEAAGVNARRD